jgi:hypothetical protein
MAAMQEAKACALLKQRFEAAGFRIQENRTFDEGGIRFEIDGIDPERRVGYEYVSSEAGDGWDVDGDVIAALEARREKGELYILVVDEAEATEEAVLGEKIDDFLDELRERGVIGGAAGGDAKSKSTAAKPAKAAPAKKPASKKKKK